MGCSPYGPNINIDVNTNNSSTRRYVIMGILRDEWVGDRIKTRFGVIA